MKMHLKLSLANEAGENFMGIGLIWLLRRVDQFHSIRAAAQDMGLSYVKALNIINRLEENLGHPVLFRHRGGHDRGGAKLTEFGKSFIEAYDSFQLEIKSLADTQFSQFEKKMSTLGNEPKTTGKKSP